MRIIKESVTAAKSGRPLKYPFENMQPGDCLKIKDISVSTYNNISSAAHHFRRKKKPDWKFSVRLNNNQISLYRVK
jgi:hypothetical protein